MTKGRWKWQRPFITSENRHRRHLRASHCLSCDSFRFFLNSLLNFVSSSKVCQLRERRLDLEEELAEEKKTSETLKKEYDALVKKAKVIDSALKTAEADLEAFQVRAIPSYIKYHEMENTLLWLAKPILPQFYEISNITLTVIV